jgi:hypothetical protein
MWPNQILKCTGCVSESGDFATLFYPVWQNWGADAAIAILKLKKFKFFYVYTLCSYVLKLNK